MQYKVLFSGMTDAFGELRRRGEVLDESEISDLARQVEIGAVEAVPEVDLSAPVEVEVQTSAGETTTVTEQPTEKKKGKK